MSDERIVWASFEALPAGPVRARLTVDGGAGYERRARRWGSLEAAEKELGPGFGEVVRKVLASGSTRGRWRP